MTVTDLSPDPMESARRIVDYVAELQAMIAWLIIEPRIKPGPTPDYDHLLPVASRIFERMTAARDRGGIMTRTHVAAMLREDMSDPTEDAEAAAYRARLRVTEIKDLVAAGATWREAVKMVDHGERMRADLDAWLSRQVEAMKGNPK